jgi:hypothetical protein
MPFGLIILGIVFVLCFTLLVYKCLDNSHEFDMKADEDARHNKPEPEEEPRDLRRRM